MIFMVICYVLIMSMLTINDILYVTLKEGVLHMSKNPQALQIIEDRALRQQNMNDVINALNPDKTEFNTMILSFADIIQSSFYPFLVAQCKTSAERKEMDDRINQNISDFMEMLNQKSLSNPEDMVILSTIMIEAITKALIRQEDSGMRVSQKLYHIKASPR